MRQPALTPLGHVRAAQTTPDKACHHHANQIHASQRIIAAHTIRSAMHVSLAQRRMKPADFAAWLRDQFGWTPATAAHLVRIGDLFGTFDENHQFQPGAMHALAAPDVPQTAIDAALTIATEGRSVTHALARRLIDQHAPPPPPKPKPRPRTVTPPATAGQEATPPATLSADPGATPPPTTEAPQPPTAAQQPVAP